MFDHHALPPKVPLRHDLLHLRVEPQHVQKRGEEREEEPAKAGDGQAGEIVDEEADEPWHEVKSVAVLLLLLASSQSYCCCWRHLKRIPLFVTG